MTTLLIRLCDSQPVASIEEVQGIKTLTILNKNYQKGLEANGVILTKEGRDVARVFPDGNPQVFLKALTEDLKRTGNHNGYYYWISEKDYNNKDSSIEQLALAVLAR